MNAQILTQNFEFIMAGLIAVVMLVMPRQSARKGSGIKTNFLDDLASIVFNLLPDAYQKWLGKQLSYAGKRSSAALPRLASFKLYPALLALFSAFAIPPAVAILVSLLTYFIADGIVFGLAKRRQMEIAAGLPQTIDLMLLCVDAGLGLDATLQRVAQDRSSLSRALNDEFAQLGRDILLGMDRDLAYQDLYQRSGVEELKSLGSALNQSSKLGLSISKILRAQSQFIRTRQSQKAEERAAKLPVWLAFPLWFCIMPSLLLILLGPSMIMFFEKLGPLR